MFSRTSISSKIIHNYRIIYVCTWISQYKYLKKRSTRNHENDCYSTYILFYQDSCKIKHNYEIFMFLHVFQNTNIWKIVLKSWTKHNLNKIIQVQLQKGFNPIVRTRVHYQGFVESNSAVSLLKKKEWKKEMVERERAAHTIRIKCSIVQFLFFMGAVFILQCSKSLYIRSVVSCLYL